MSDLESNPSNIDIRSQILICLKEKVDNLDMQIANICAEKNMTTMKQSLTSLGYLKFQKFEA